MKILKNGLVTFLALIASVPANAFILSNYYAILNNCKKTIEINYKYCLNKTVNKKVTITCEDKFISLRSGESKIFDVNQDDNNVIDKENQHYHVTYIYQVSSENSSGNFLYGPEDEAVYKRDHDKDLLQGMVEYCQLNYLHSVILDDFGGDRIYCLTVGL